MRRSIEDIRRIVAEYEDAPFGSKGVVLRRNQVSHNTVSRWMFMRDAGDLEAFGRHGRKRMTPTGESAELKRLRAEITRLEAQLVKAEADRAIAETAAAALGKAQALLQKIYNEQVDQER